MCAHKGMPVRHTGQIDPACRKELIREHPQPTDVLHIIQEEGVAKLGEFDVPVGLARRSTRAYIVDEGRPDEGHASKLAPSTTRTHDRTNGC